MSELSEVGGVQSVRGEISQSPEKNRNQARLVVGELGLKRRPQAWEIERLSKIIEALLHLQCSWLAQRYWEVE